MKPDPNPAIAAKRQAALAAVEAYRNALNRPVLNLEIDLVTLCTGLRHLAKANDLDWGDLMAESKYARQQDKQAAKTIAPPAPGLHISNLTGPRRADAIGWVRDYLTRKLDGSEIPAHLVPDTQTLDDWADRIVDHLVRITITVSNPTSPDAIVLTEALYESQRAAENAASWEGAWPNPPRPATPDADTDDDDDTTGED